MKRLRSPQILAILAACGLVFFLLVGFAIRSLHRNEQRQQREIPRIWARLVAYPASAQNLQTSTSGSSFTRSFRVSFSAPKAEIERWLQDSPGTCEATPDHATPNQRHFAIKPGGGAQHAEITVDDAVGLVSIYVYWS